MSRRGGHLSGGSIGGGWLAMSFAAALWFPFGSAGSRALAAAPTNAAGASGAVAGANTGGAAPGAPVAGAPRPKTLPGLPGSAGPKSGATTGDAASASAGIVPIVTPAPGTATEPGDAAVAPVAGTPSADGQAGAEPERVVPIGDATAAASDHDMVAGAFGIEVRRIESTAPVLARDMPTGCTMGTPSICPPVVMNVLAVRRWVSRTLAWSGGLALSAGGGREGDRLLDTHFGMGPSFGLAVLLANWKHMAVSASPDVTVVFFRPSGSSGTGYLADLRTDIEAELHLGMLGVPALSLGIRSGVVLRLEHADDVSLWTLGVAGTTTLWGLVNQLVLRYYF